MQVLPKPLQHRHQAVQPLGFDDGDYDYDYDDAHDDDDDEDNAERKQQQDAASLARLEAVRLELAALKSQLEAAVGVQEGVPPQ